MYSEESIRSPLLIKNQAGCCFPSKAAVLPAETNSELNLAQQKRGKSPEKGIEYFRLMSPSVELWQVALKAESCRSWSATSGRGICLYLPLTYLKTPIVQLRGCLRLFRLRACICVASGETLRDLCFKKLL